MADGHTPGGNTTTAGAVEGLALKIVKAHYPEMPDSYRGRRYQIALAAIVETTEAAARHAEQMPKYVHAADVAWDFRNGYHLKGPKP